MTGQPARSFMEVLRGPIVDALSVSFVHALMHPMSVVMLSWGCSRAVLWLIMLYLVLPALLGIVKVARRWRYDLASYVSWLDRFPFRSWVVDVCATILGYYWFVLE